jgi:4'-phosphopantetheinyl transferase
VVAHGTLRQLLGRYLGTHPGQLRFVHNAFGKPELSPECGSPLRFNLSHSADLALIAIAAGADIGVDIERIRAQPDYAAIARRFFSAAEVEYLNGLPSHLYGPAFVDGWTKKEAFLKACGQGLARLDDAPEDTAAARSWSLFTLQPAPGYIGAVAIEGSGWRLTQRQWQSTAGGAGTFQFLSLPARS